MNCADINKKLQLFLEDLLIPEDYDAFVAHMKECGKCKEYVRSVGSLSNQLWKLGHLRVPEDLSSTIIYRLTHPETETSASFRFAPSKRSVVVGFSLAFLVGALFLGRTYLKGREKEPPGPTIRTQVVFDSRTPSASEARSLFEQLQNMAARLEGPEEGSSLGGPAEETGLDEEEGSLPAGASTSAEALVTGGRPLHWHFRTGAGRSAGLIEAFAALDVQWVFQKDPLFVFSGTGEDVERTLEQMLSSAGAEPLFSDFTSRTPTVLTGVYRVSIYVEDSTDGALHWHIGPLAPDTKSRVRDIVQEFSDTIDYDSQELMVFSILPEKLESFRRRLRAMRVPLSEFGGGALLQGALRRASLELSIYFGG